MYNLNREMNFKIKLLSSYSEEDFRDILKEQGVELDNIQVDFIPYPNGKSRPGFELGGYKFFNWLNTWQCIEAPKDSWTEDQLKVRSEELEKTQGQVEGQTLNWCHTDAKKSKKYYTRYKTTTGGIEGFNPTTHTFRGNGRPMEAKEETKKRLNL